MSKMGREMRNERKKKAVKHVIISKWNETIVDDLT